MSEPLPSRYEPAAHEAAVTAAWREAKSFAATPDARDDRYVIMMPLPNVTGALHMGHAMDNVMQDLLIRWHRMTGDNTLWMPGTDHAGIATQAVVEKRLFELEGKTRHDVGRDALIERIWDWKARSEKRIIGQQEQMGCSCDWDRHRFTMDEGCQAAVRESFFRFFEEGLIYRGDRLVNWDCHLQTAVSDDEVEHKSVKGHFWHLRYPVIDPKDGEPTEVIVATTRPETMLGDTAVAVHPEPRRILEERLAAAEERLQGAADKERDALEAERDRLKNRIATLLPKLELLVAMAKDGRTLMLPLQERPIPLILDEWAKPELGSGCVKITPAHDPNDYEVWQRHRDRIPLINILRPDGSLNENAGAYEGLDRFEARKKVVADFEAAGLLDRVEDRDIEVGHSDRSKTPVEPYVSKQWFVSMGDQPDGIVMGRGTNREFRTQGLAQAAIDAVAGEWKSPSGRKLVFHPDADRYAGTYVNWLAEKRDWCISRQLWWGHQIPIWSLETDAADLGALLSEFAPSDHCALWIVDENGNQRSHAETLANPGTGRSSILVCIRDKASQETLAPALEARGFERDPDVLDTWFSSALWPFSTLGWPDAERVDAWQPDRSPLAAQDGFASALDYYYPGSCLVTGRDIITLWVARMVIFGLYTQGDLPFTDVFIHATILDGKGERMSKSKGNGIDPVDIIEAYGSDALRYVMCLMQTGMQDIRLPVQAISPFDGELVELATAKRGKTLGTYIDPKSGQEFDVLGTHPTAPTAKTTSDRFEVGRNFCNKLWNATRFALMNLEEQPFQALDPKALPCEDRWILSRLANAIEEIDGALRAYRPSQGIERAREFFWNELCDWYLEIVKPRMKDPEQAPVARQVLATLLDQILRLLHPFLPFVTETLWKALGATKRGIEAELESPALLVGAAWPAQRSEWRDPALDGAIAQMQGLVEASREIRASYDIPNSRALPIAVKLSAEAEAALAPLGGIMSNMMNAEPLHLSTAPDELENSAARVVGEAEVTLGGVVDPAKERARLDKEKANVEKQLNGLRGKLGNEKFRSRAPADVVEREEARLARLEAELAAIEARLAKLG